MINNIEYIKINLASDKYAALEKEQEYNLIKQAQQGSLSAKNCVIEANLRFVFNLAFKYSLKSNSTFEDLFQEGVSGLNASIFKFDFKKKKNIKFYSFAQYYIRNSFIKYIRENTHNVKIDLANRKENIYDFIETNVDDYTNYDDGHFKLTPEPLKTFQSNSDDIQHMQYYIQKLHEEEQYLLNSFYGIGLTQKKNYSQLAEEFGISNAGMKRVFQKILLNLRKQIE